MVRRRGRGSGSASGWIEAAAAVCLLAAGCAEELGPERMPTVRVSGVVREGTRPVTGGWVEFMPIQGAVGLMRSAPIGRDGRFSADFVPVGPVAIGVNGAPLSSRVGRLTFDSLRTPIRRTIPATGAVELDIDLYRELVELEIARSRPLP